MGGICTPGYKSGFYSPRRGGVPKYPSLWRDCVAAYCPALGSTGERLFDQARGGIANYVGPGYSTSWGTGSGKTCLAFNTTFYYDCTPVVFMNGLTISAFVTNTGTGVRREIIAQDLASGSARNFHLRIETTERLSFFIWNSSVTLSNVVGALPIPTGGVSHVVARWDASGSGAVNLFVNGVLDTNSGTLTGGPNATIHHTMRIGARSVSNLFAGNLFEVSVFDSVLSNSQIMQMAKNGPGNMFELNRNYYATIAAGGSFIPNFMHHYRQQGVA